MYEERGIAPAVARDMVHEVMQDPELALETHAREELGISSQAPRLPRAGRGVLVPRRSRSARSYRSLPWLITSGNAAIAASIILTVIASLTIGVVLATFTQRSAVRSALRQLLITAMAAGVTYGIGRAIGTGVA